MGTSSTPIGSVQGLASGIQWQDMITQIIQLDTTRELTPLQTEQSKEQSQLNAWNAYKAIAQKFHDAAAALQSGTAFDKFSVTGGTDGSGTKLLSATANAGAIPGTYKAEVVDIARAEKLGSNNVADVTAAMNLSGTFFVGGKQITIASTDSLSQIRDKINAANTGSTPSRVSASILTVSSGVNRLVLTSDVGGSAGIELSENDGSTVLSDLGVVSASLVANTIDGEARSYGFTSSSSSLAQTLSAAMPLAGSFDVNGTAVSIDLSQDSLTSIASNINAAVGAGTASVSSEVVNGSTVYRLMVNGTVTTDAGSSTSQANLQQLGLLKNDRGAGMQLIAPTDAQLRLDGVLIKRSTNTISDALAGVTFNLLQPESGTTVDLTISRDTSSTISAVKDFADAYNSLAKYVSDQTASTGALAFDSTLRGTLSTIKDLLFSSVTGLANTTYTSPALAGVALDSTGQLQVDETALTTALQTNPGEMRALFASAGTSTSTAVQYMATSAKTQAGNYAVAITHAATTPTATGSALASAYNNSAVANTMNVFDNFTGRTVSISLVDADTASTIAEKLNEGFGNSAVKLSASVTGSNELKLTGAQYGVGASFTVSFALNGAAAASQLGFSSSAYTGTDVAGTINGKSATGAGQMLTADPPATGDTNPAEGLAVLYTGTADVAAANVSYVLGMGGMLVDAAQPIIDTGSGLIDSQATILQQSIDALTQRENDVQTRLDARRASLTTQFTAMESALSRIQAQSAALTNQINSLSSLQPSSK